MENKTNKIYIAADHAGFALKEELRKYLESLNFTVEDLGNLVLDEQDDYPDFMTKVAEAVTQDPESRGIVIGGSGQGEAMAANKIKGARAAILYDEYSAKMSRLHNDANIAALGARTMDIEKAKMLIKLWLDTLFSEEERHKRRIEKLNEL